MMSLWHLLHAVCVAIAVGSSVVPAGIANAGLAGCALAVTVGLAVGLCCALTMWTAGKVIGIRIRTLPNAVHEKYFRLLYLGAMFWILLTGLFGHVAAFLILRLAL